MQMIHTQNFSLAIYSRGSADASALALVLPGKLDTKDYPHMRSHVELLAGLGFHALSFDPPGTWESGGDIVQYTTANYTQAIRELIAYYGAKPTFLMGHSRGGTIAVLAAVQNPEVKAIAVVMSKISKSAGKVDTAWRERGYRISARDCPEDPTRQREFALPFSCSDDSRSYDVSAEIKRLSIPKLFLAGTGDPVAPPEKMRGFYDAALEPKRFAVIDSDHDYRRSPDKIEEVNHILREFVRDFSSSIETSLRICRK